ncbi:MAG TPA: sn-glycerol-3-phosphate ABC transporter ATP-binding protein UgpC [Solirubrobacteraceae bacterium]|jgi:multiple sugar transport system ATP-binding protein|nr:sn-glycerol-3-phosphate ABC transporter ATP-binding protein UgpC [Solirubrobacteraceae bacterium]
MATISYINATCVYPGASAPSVDNLSLEVADGEFMVLVGPSGSGKSTALRMLAGLEQVSTGEIRINGTDVSQRAPKDRNIAMVFQNYALYPHMNVADNMGFALKLSGVPKPEREVKIKEAAALLDLTPYLDRKPKALSGGQRQRVAMGRAIVREPSVFLMDEPLSNLDAKLRVETRANIAGLQARLGTTTIYVTHDQVEAMTMGHRVAVLRDGQLQQVDTPRNLYDRPANVFVAGFIGSPAMNLRTATLGGEGATLAGAAIAVPDATLAAARAANLSELTLGLRPEATTLASSDQSGTLPLTVTLVEELGADAYVYGTLEGDAPGDKPWVLRCDNRTVPTIGQQVRVTVDPSSIQVFNPASGVRL